MTPPIPIAPLVDPHPHDAQPHGWPEILKDSLGFNYYLNDNFIPLDGHEATYRSTTVGNNYYVVARLRNGGFVVSEKIKVPA